MDIIVFLCTLVIGVFCARTVDVQNGGSVIIPCNLAGTLQYPTWSGPEGLKNPLNNGQQINQDDFQWANNSKDLIVSHASPRYHGDYTCSSAGKSASVKLNVLYIQGPHTHYTKTVPKLGDIEFACWVYSNPNSSISWTTLSAFQGRSEVTPTVCEDVDMDTLYKNECRSKLRVSLVTEEDNGRRVTCYVAYPNETKKTDILLDLDIRPNYIDITMSDHWQPITKTGIVELTCSTNNVPLPEPELKWFRGKDDIIEQNQVLTADKAFSEGTSITEKLMLNVDHSMDGEKIHCCVGQKSIKSMGRCVSRLISLNTSASIIVSPSKLLLFGCLLLITWFRQ